VCALAESPEECAKPSPLPSSSVELSLVNEHGNNETGNSKS
jgi:hypothetical protein